ncbi:bifunctional UDP-N-acetylglucosamine diphosphorylase/glucosamine-1-phosphate N-acetyltransferase GlmU [Helicobacter suis]|uniref:bifunctional UDP-N-acetylglucosamine diphosphorylase/glucosamine-1-phosphate N-acetyltransferase GlmU n=1 Tax=Helicobacter suis TaxID=104628 RepID=UPI000CF01355|nr:bifunctional UDP-N-acetylglucosamine diphosphorylase/glucosamine-1-phosphate N-acetyltransferase GlmU [Helicobacter suis]
MAVSVVILAAGKGTRMRSSLPKVLHKICGQEMLLWILQEALCISDDVHVILQHQHEKIEAVIKKAFKDTPFSLHLQNPNFPGTGGALMNEDKNPLKTAHSHVLVLNADMPLITKEALQPFINKANNAIGVFKLENPAGYGRVQLKQGKVKAIIEEKDANTTTLALDTLNAGVYLFDQALLNTFLPKLDNLNAQKEYYLTQLVQLATQAGVEFTPVFVNPTYFLGVNSQSERAKAEEVMLRRLRQSAMDLGVCMHLEHTIYLEKGVVFEGNCILEQGVCLIGPCYLKDAHIKAHSVIEQSTIIASSVGPLAHIRPGCSIIDSHVGNFVEIKNAQLSGVKAGHLSYLGDCQIQRGTNIGAGVITCNYDGKNKHSITIGENVFIGSDTQLIAPLNIPSHVLIGAGSSVSQEMQEGDLVLTRAPQINKAQGYYRFFNKTPKV